VAPDAPVPAVAHMAAAVIALRDGAGGPEVLVGQRTYAARFMGGFWVFPGGRVDPEDGDGEAAWPVAAARELHEEAGIEVDPATLAPFDRWVTPEPLPRRFDTVFFLARIGADVVERIDGEEIIASRWATPRALLADAEAGRAVLAFPTLRQLEALAAFASTADAFAGCPDGVPEPVTPVFTHEDGEEPQLVVPGPDGRPVRFRAGDVPAGEARPDGR
jgi:8-oxo-dGTP pyrophosphatase MutT (NUDIX family)